MRRPRWSTFWYGCFLAMGLCLAVCDGVRAEPLRVWDDWFAGDPDTQIQIQHTANDVGVVSTTIVKAPSHGTLAANSPEGLSYAYIPQPGFLGADTFTYKAVGDGVSAEGKVTIIVSRPKTVIHQENVPRYGVWERTVTNSNAYTNPFDFRVIELRGTFTAPSGAITRFFGFFDGDGRGGQEGHTWRIRFMPTETGTYHYKLSFSDGTPIADASGSFTVVESDLPGPPRLLGDTVPQSYFLKDAREKPIKWKGYNLHGIMKGANLRGASGVPYLRAILEDQVVGQGYNATMISNGRMLFDPFILRGEGFDLEGLRVKDRFVDFLAAEKVWTVNWTCHVGNTSFWKEFYDNYEPIVRYFVARYAPFYNYFGWSSTWETWETHDGINPDKQGHVQAVALYTQSISPWEKFPTTHDRVRAAWTSWQRIQLRQKQCDTVSDGNNRRIGAFDGYRYVIIGSEGLWERTDRQFKSAANGAEIRHGLWGELLAGVYTLYHEWNSFGGYPAAGPGNGEGDTFNRIAMDFWYDNTTWYNYQMKNRLLGSPRRACCSGWTGHEYVVYDQDGGSNSIYLREASGKLQLTWLDPLTGQTVDGGMVNGGGALTLTPPASISGEWCAWLRKPRD